jgi:hypothetical protein
MRILLLLIIVFSAAIAGLSFVAGVSVRTEQIDMRGELAHSLQTGDPPVDALLDSHFSRMTRFQDHWGTARLLAVGSGLGALVCFGLTFRKTQVRDETERIGNTRE